MSYADDVTVVIPTIPPRGALLNRALISVFGQTRPAAAVSVAMDVHREGAWTTRDRALQVADSRVGWVAFLDDDDEFKEDHLERLWAHAVTTGADYVFSWFDTKYCFDPLGHFGREFDPKNPTHTTITTMVRTELAKRVGFTPPAPGDIAGGEDWRFTLGCLELGAKIVHLPERTWYWHHHSGNTSGRPERW